MSQNELSAKIRELREFKRVQIELPETGKNVLLYSEKENCYFVGAYSDTYRTFFVGNYATENITHWAELPPVKWTR